MASFQEPEILQLEMTATEDPMELSSEMNPPASAEDIDIDLLTSDFPQEREDDFMAEDGRSVTDQELPDIEALQAGNDDEMFDDEYLTGDLEEKFSVHDEDLQDAEESIIRDGADTIVSAIEANPVARSISRQEEDKATHTNMEACETSEQYSEDILEPASQLDPADEQYQANADPQITNPHSMGPPRDPENGSLAHNSGTDTVESPYDRKPESLAEIPTTHDNEQEPPELSLKPLDNTTNQDESLALNSNSSQNSAYVHPVVVLYQDNEMSLFPPVNQDQEHSQTYFLQDETYAAGSINNLLGACRSVLGESISEQDELDIQIGELGLHISEFAQESYTTTFAEILDIYVQLQQNDGVDSPGPLYIALFTKIRFSHRVNYLTNAVAEGKGFSQLSLLESPDEDEPQSGDSEKQDGVGEDDLHNPDISAYAEVEGDRPVNVWGSDEEKEEDKEEDNQRLAPNIQDDFERSRSNKEAPSADPQDGNVRLPEEAQSMQLRGTRGEDSGFNKDDTDLDQYLIPKVEEEIAISSPVGVNEHEFGKLEEPTAEEEDLINYEDEEGDDETNHGPSTRSSTIQGDSIETTKFDLTTTIDYGLNDEPAESLNQQLQEDGHKRGPLIIQDQCAGGAGGVFEAGDVEGGTHNEEGLEADDDGELLGLEEPSEELEPDLDEQDEYGHEEVDRSSPSQENEPDAKDQGTYNDDPPGGLPSDARQTESVLTNKLTKQYQGSLDEEEHITNTEFTYKHRGSSQAGLHEGPNGNEDNFDLAVNLGGDGDDTVALKANGTLSHGYEPGLDHSDPTSALDTIPDRDSHERPVVDNDEINYEDEDDVVCSMLPTEQSANASPGYLKRTRIDDEDNVSVDDDLQDLKRIRS